MRCIPTGWAPISGPAGISSAPPSAREWPVATSGSILRVTTRVSSPPAMAHTLLHSSIPSPERVNCPAVLPRLMSTMPENPNRQPKIDRRVSFSRNTTAAARISRKVPRLSRIDARPPGELDTPR